jgi:hypothetical protein
MTDITAVQAWFNARIPTSWFAGPVEAIVDAEEILVAGALADPPATGAEPVPDIVRSAGVKRFREETRTARMAVAAEAEGLFGRRVSWAVDSGGERVTFTTVSVPVMTRLRQPERIVLDTLVESGVARSRSDALAWCVRLVGRHQGDWIRDLQAALVHVHKVRAEGPAES